MPHANAFEPIWPPANDADFNAWPEVREARKMYESQKRELTELVGQAPSQPAGADTPACAQARASQRPNMRGTAPA